MNLDGNRYGVDPDVLLAIAKVESAMNPVAEGDHGHSHGLFQINDYWLHHFHLPRKAMLNPIINAQWRVYVLAHVFIVIPAIINTDVLLGAIIPVHLKRQTS